MSFKSWWLCLSWLNTHECFAQLHSPRAPLIIIFFLSRHVGSRWRWRMNLREEDQRDVMLIYGHPRIHGSYQSLITILNFAFLENHQLLGIWSSSELDHSTKSKPKVLPVPWHIAHLFSILWGDSMTASKNSDRSYHHHQVLYTSAQNFFNFFFLSNPKPDSQDKILRLRWPWWGIKDCLNIYFHFPHPSSRM